MNHEAQALLTIAWRDVTKLLRDRMRLLANLIFPAVFIGALGSSMQANLGATLPYNFLTFVFTGVLAQTLFQSTASGVISLVEDRQNDFAQTLFITPVSRYTIVIGKIIGEMGVAGIQAVMVILFSLLLGVPLEVFRLFLLIPIAVLVGLFGGAFGTAVMANFPEQRAANQIFPFLLFPQFFLAGVFNPIQQLPTILLILSRLAPMTYAVDLLRSVYYFGTPEYSQVVLFSPAFDLIVVSVVTVIFIVSGTLMFVRREKNK
jgi:ABC-2 type transport system permease protein